jgi:hypothetical protein
MDKVNYGQAYRDHEFLWQICPARDMTGGYQDSDDLSRLLKSPTRTTAKQCLIHQIHYWFEAGTEDGRSAFCLAQEYPEIEGIAERYNIRF